jgi:hydrogenase expression/formation protein HypC
MCLAIPGKIKSIDEMRMADVDIMGVSRKASLDLVPEADVGDYVLVHAGFAIQHLDEQFAEETLELFRSLDIEELRELIDAEEEPAPTEAAGE